jgi:hypothetical protein
MEQTLQHQRSDFAFPVRAESGFAISSVRHQRVLRLSTRTTSRARHEFGLKLPLDDWHALIAFLRTL